MELTAATVAVRADKMLRNELEIQIDSSEFWTDSMSVLRYIRNQTSRFHTFVANRLTVIHDGSNVENWHYVNTKLNPADLASRGLPVDKNKWTKLWIMAPDFLWSVQNHWPEYPMLSVELNEDDPEVKRVKVNSVVVESKDVEIEMDVINKLINKHSSWFKLKKSVAWILKVRKELLRRVRYKNNSQEEKSRSRTLDFNKISVDELEEAERAILMFVQRNIFPEEIKMLKNGNIKRNSTIRKLDPILENGVLRVGGRLHKSCMPAESKHPAILPKGHHLSTLILRKTHEDLKHAGRNHMLSTLRQQYWIVNAPSAIRKLLSKCVTCRRYKAPVGEQKMANLPEDRVTPDEPPFTRVGVDYFGPFMVQVKRSRVKRYGAIFTCLASRAIHIEVAHSLDTDSYINALRRFIARRGQVTKMLSDNGTNFIGAERELRQAIGQWNLDQINQAMLQRNIDWKFNPPAGSHFGGVWERLIKSIRSAVNSTVREQVLDDERLNTLMCEVEAVLNSRPITKNSDQCNDLEALTPNHLLTLKSMPNLPPGLFDQSDNYCRRRWRQIQYMANLFWKRWSHEYLPLLQERQKWHEVKRNIKIGDVVLIVDSNAPRNSWPMGVIVETMPDSLGLVRQVKEKTVTNILVRPIDKLCVILEMD